MASSQYGYLIAHPWIQSAFAGALIGIIGIVLIVVAFQWLRHTERERSWRQLLKRHSGAEPATTTFWGRRGLLFKRDRPLLK